MEQAASNLVSASAAEPGAEELRHSREEFLARGLIVRIVAKEEQALRELYTLWAPTLLGIAHRLIGDRSEAEEAVQDTFVRIWQRAASYDPGQARPFVWAYSILRGASVDQLRRKGRQKRGGGLAFESFTGREVDDAGASQVIHREVSEQIIKGLAGLPAEDRRCLELYLFQEFTQQEIATEVRSPLGTIKTRVRRSLRRLREIIEHHA
jgi:RNA polymerase sigma-70 factor (ECF subfamily)